MKNLLTTCALSLTLGASLPAAELLLNGSFEGPVGTSLGNNIGTVPNHWIIGSTATATSTDNVNLSNLVNGTATGTQAPNSTSTTTLPAYSGNQSLDGVNTTIYAIQTFTLSIASPLFVTATFGGRDYTSAGSTSNWTLTTDADPSTILYQGTATAPTFGQWATDSLTTGTLPSGSYRINITLANPHEVDAVSITNVPEPSTVAAVAGGLFLLGVGMRRARRS